MILSDEQMAVVRHGTKQPPFSWEWVDLPVGPQPLPHWAKGLKIQWMDGYMNSPSFTLKTPKGFNMRSWDGMAYRKYGNRYLAESGDGRAMCYYHEGEPRLQELTHWTKSHVGMMPAGPLTRGFVNLPPERRVAEPWRYNGGPFYHWHSPYQGWATYKDRGFGGSTVPVRLDDGRLVLLRGPWHGPAPDGYQDCGTGSGGILISEDVLILMVARFYPHCRVARITQGTRTWIEPVREDWDMPKRWMDEARRIDRARMGK